MLINSVSIARIHFTGILFLLQKSDKTGFHGYVSCNPMLLLKFTFALSVSEETGRRSERRIHKKRQFPASGMRKKRLALSAVMRAQSSGESPMAAASAAEVYTSSPEWLRCPLSGVGAR